jgi:hypothetical protein
MAGRAICGGPNGVVAKRPHVAAVHHELGHVIKRRGAHLHTRAVRSFYATRGPRGQPGFRPRRDFLLYRTQGCTFDFLIKMYPSAVRDSLVCMCLLSSYTAIRCHPYVGRQTNSAVLKVPEGALFR